MDAGAKELKEIEKILQNHGIAEDKIKVALNHISTLAIKRELSLVDATDYLLGVLDVGKKPIKDFNNLTNPSDI